MTLEIAKGELVYGRDICKNPEGYTWDKTYHYYFCSVFQRRTNLLKDNLLSMNDNFVK